MRTASTAQAPHVNPVTDNRYPGERTGQSKTLFPESIVMHKIVSVATYPQVMNRCDGITQSHTERYGKVVREIEQLRNFGCHFLSRQRAYDMDADPEGVGHQPHVFHRATEAEDAQEIAF
jgi:hypothetical protein